MHSHFRTLQSFSDPKTCSDDWSVNVFGPHFFLFLQSPEQYWWEFRWPSFCVAQRPGACETTVPNQLPDQAWNPIFKAKNRWRFNTSSLTGAAVWRWIKSATERLLLTNNSISYFTSRRPCHRTQDEPTTLRCVEFYDCLPKAVNHRLGGGVAAMPSLRSFFRGVKWPQETVSPPMARAWEAIIPFFQRYLIQYSTHGYLSH